MHVHHTPPPQPFNLVDDSPSIRLNQLQGALKNPPWPTGTPCPLPHCAGSPVDMCPPAVISECDQCVTECNVESCVLNTEEQCTERCVVIPCDNPCLDSCGMCTTPLSTQCESEQCQGFEDLLKSCTDLSYLEPSYPNSVNQASISQDDGGALFPDWSNANLSRELDALLCACGNTQLLPHSFDSSSCDPRLVDKPRYNLSRHPLPQPPATSIPPSVSVPVSSPGSTASNLISPKMTPSVSSCSSPDPLPFVSTPSAGLASTELTTQNDPPNQQYCPEPLMCLWAACGKVFNTAQDLSTHVNRAHLHLSLSGDEEGRHISAFPGQSSVQSSSETTIQDLSMISCLWDNCNRYPTPTQVPGPSIGNVIEAAKGFLACHVQQDHLGIPISRQPAGSQPSDTVLDGELAFPDVAPCGSHTLSNMSTHCRNSPSPLIGHQNPQCCATTAPDLSQYLCKWRHCTLANDTFGSAAELTAHIANVHVGVGNSRYHCLWEGCNRNGDAGFSSKQKILRHVQSHTGHRPFKCDICDQYFSEAATLQQHMRRHTKEKPYICDFPGCNKAFAITGALTIHRRVHSGSKPFKCPHCNRSFSESSNLSKHIRTHTGDRPYVCPHPGCEKKFARPDQVARHKNVHIKKGDHIERSVASMKKP